MLLDLHTAKIGIDSGWLKALFTNIGIDTCGPLKIQTSWSNSSFNELHGIWVSFLVLVISSGGTSLRRMNIGYFFTLHSGVSSGCCNIDLIIPTIQSMRSTFCISHSCLKKFSIIIFIKYLHMTPLSYMIYDLYTLFIKESSNMRGQLSWFQSDSSLLNIHYVLSSLVPKVNVKGTDPYLHDHYTVK